MRKIEDENPVEEPWEPDDDYKHRGKRISNKTHRSQTDPDARLARKSEKGQTFVTLPITSWTTGTGSY